MRVSVGVSALRGCGLAADTRPLDDRLDLFDPQRLVLQQTLGECLELRAMVPQQHSHLLLDAANVLPVPGGPMSKIPLVILLMGPICDSAADS